MRLLPFAASRYMGSHCSGQYYHALPRQNRDRCSRIGLLEGRHEAAGYHGADRANRDEGSQGFRCALSQHQRELFGVCLRILNNRSEAEEVVQEVFVKVWTRADRFAVSELSPISWLVAIARHQAIDRIRVRRLPTSDLDAALNVSDTAPNPEMAVLAHRIPLNTMRTWLRRSLIKLKECLER